MNARLEQQTQSAYWPDAVQKQIQATQVRQWHGYRKYFGTILKHNPKNPDWPDRDRFVLSNGRVDAHLPLLHLSGYDLGIEDIKAFRQLHSRTPGHPEYGYTPGVETTTGPLGRGGGAVGPAVAEKRWLPL